MNLVGGSGSKAIPVKRHQSKGKTNNIINNNQAKKVKMKNQMLQNTNFVDKVQT